MESWQELANPRDLTKIFTQNLEYTAWNWLRNTKDARYIGLAMPRFLSRLPYGANTNPVDEFDFEEETSSADHSRYAWTNAAYAIGVNINRSFKKYSWLVLTDPRSGVGRYRRKSSFATRSRRMTATST